MADYQSWGNTNTVEAFVFMWKWWVLILLILLYPLFGWIFEKYVCASIWSPALIDKDVNASTNSNCLLLYTYIHTNVWDGLGLVYKYHRCGWPRVCLFTINNDYNYNYNKIKIKKDCIVLFCVLFSFHFWVTEWYGTNTESQSQFQLFTFSK